MKTTRSFLLLLMLLATSGLNAQKGRRQICCARKRSAQ